MSKLRRVWLLAATLVLFVMGTGTSSGQQRQTVSGKVRDQAAIQRSLAIQGELARIEASREEFIDELFARWAPTLDPMLYDLWGSLKPVAMAATPWRLLGASLTTDFESGLRVLTGAVGPGWYVSAYVEGREPVIGATMAQAQAGAPEFGATAIGDTTSSLVFTPIAPCRVVDTRGTGARTGLLSSPTPFDFTTAGLAKGQGGATSCPGLPSSQTPVAWAVNVTATGYGTIGHVTVYPATATVVPTASFLNFSPAVYAVANAGTVTGCYGCSETVGIYAYAPTHIIVDVMGYYTEATGFAGGAVTEMWGPDTAIPGYGFVSAYGGYCPAGTVLIGGGSSNTSGAGEVLTADHLRSGQRWLEYLSSYTSSEYSFQVYSHCMDVK